MAALCDGEVVKYTTWGLGVGIVLDEVDEALGAQELRARIVWEGGERLDALRDKLYIIVVGNHRQRIDGIDCISRCILVSITVLGAHRMSMFIALARYCAFCF